MLTIENDLCFLNSVIRVEHDKFKHSPEGTNCFWIKVNFGRNAAKEIGQGRHFIKLVTNSVAVASVQIIPLTARFNVCEAHPSKREQS